MVGAITPPQATQVSAPVAAAAPAMSDDEIASKIEKLGGLLAKGLISQTEFDQGKAELLKKLIG
jgi:hypothetical protein